MSKTKDQDNAFLPTIQELVVYSVVAFVLLTALNFNRILFFYKNIDRPLPPSENAFRLVLLEKIDSRILPTIITFAFWAVVGLVVYLGIWLLISMFNDASGGIGALHGFVFPKKSDRSKYEIAIARRFGLRLLGMVGTILWIAVLLTKVIPACSPWFYLALTHDQSAAAIALFFYAFIGLGLYLFLLAPLLRMVVLKPRVFSDW